MYEVVILVADIVAEEGSRLKLGHFYYQVIDLTLNFVDFLTKLSAESI